MWPTRSLDAMHPIYSTLLPPRLLLGPFSPFTYETEKRDINSIVFASTKEQNRCPVSFLLAYSIRFAAHHRIDSVVDRRVLRCGRWMGVYQWGTGRI